MVEELRKQTKNNGLLSVREVPVELAKELTVKNHYSHKWASTFGLINFGIFKDNNPECLGVAVFGHLMNPNSYASICEGIEKDGIIELNRLWLDDVLGKNAETTFLAMCFKLIKKNYPHIKLVQSFADGRLGCGTIYKAANFAYFGSTESLFFEHKQTNVVQHKVPFEDTRSLASLALLNLELVRGNYKPFKVKTYRYIYVLDKNYEKRIKFKRLPYPEYSKGIYYLPEFTQSIGVLSRAYMAFYWLNDDASMTQIKSYITKHYGVLSHNQIRKHSESKTMNKYLADEDAAKEKLKRSYSLLVQKLGKTEVVA